MYFNVDVQDFSANNNRGKLLKFNIVFVKEEIRNLKYLDQEKVIKWYGECP